MAGISLPFGIKDNVTPTFSKIEKQTIANAREFMKLNKQGTELENVMKLLKDAGLEDTEMFRGLNSASEKVTDTMTDLVDGTRNANVALNGASLGAKDTQTSMIALNQTLELVQKGWGLVKQAVQEAYKWMDMYNQDFNAEFTGGIKMHNILGAGSNEIKEMFGYASQLQQTGVVGDEAIKSGMAELAMYTGTMSNLRKLTPLMLDMAVADKGVYTTMSDVTSAASQLGRALNGQAMMLKREYKLTDDQIKQLNSLNDVTDKTNYLYDIMADKVSNANEILSQTSQGGLMQTRNALSDLQEALGEKVTPYIAEFERAFYTLIQPAVEWLIDNLDTLIPILLGTAAVLGVIVATMAIINFGSLILLIGTIGLVIYGITQWMKAQDELTGQTHSALGLIAGMLTTFAAFVYNIIIMPIWNVLAALANFIGNMLNDPVANIEILFLDLAKTIMNIASTIAGVIDTLFGTSTQTQINGWINSLERTKNKIIATSDYEEIMPTLDNWDIAQAAKQGYEFGDNMSKSISKAIDDNDFFQKLGSAFVPGDNGTTALNTTSGDKPLGEEDIQLLLDIATRDVRFEMQQVTPQIEISFTGDINSPMDIDSVSEAVVTQLEEALDSDLEVAFA